jgi:hypothetical protein
VTVPLTFAVVLAGGLARRIDGSDKGVLRIGDTSILERVVARLTPQCDCVIFNVNDDTAEFVRAGLAVAADSIAGCAGPLAAILAGLDWFARHVKNPLLQLIQLLLKQIDLRGAPPSRAPTPEPGSSTHLRRIDTDRSPRGGGFN